VVSLFVLNWELLEELVGSDKAHKGHFVLETHGQHICIRTCHGRYISVNTYGGVYHLDDPHSFDAKFTQEWHPEHHGKFAFRSYHGRYLGIRDHKVIAWPEFTAHELFQEFPV